MVVMKFGCPVGTACDFFYHGQTGGIAVGSTPSTVSVPVVSNYLPQARCTSTMSTTVDIYDGTQATSAALLHQVPVTLTGLNCGTSPTPTPAPSGPYTFVSATPVACSQPTSSVGNCTGSLVLRVASNFPIGERIFVQAFPAAFNYTGVVTATPPSNVTFTMTSGQMFCSSPLPVTYLSILGIYRIDVSIPVTCTR